jgi:hypothetical protein
VSGLAKNNIRLYCIDMDESKKSYEDYRTMAIMNYKKVYKDSLAFDMAKVPKDFRLILVEDDVYLTDTKAIKAELYAKSITTLQEVIDGDYAEDGKDPTGNLLKALEMRNKILFNDLNIEADESNALNITMVELSREALSMMETVEVSISGSNDADSSFAQEKGNNK